MGEAKRVKEQRASRFLSLPATMIGKCSACLLLLSLLLILLNVFLVLPASEQRTGLELPQVVVSFSILLCILSSGISGLFALVMKRERSWTVVVSVLSLIMVMAFALSDVLIPG